MQNQTQSNGKEKSGYSKSKILRMITAGFVAFLLWFFVISVERTETEQTFSNVEVRFVGYSPAEDVDILKDRGLKIVSDTEDLTVDLKLHGRRSVLNSLRSSDMYVEVNLQSIYETGTRNMTYEIKYPGDVDSSGIEVISRNPDSITVKVVSWVEKKIELMKPQIIGEPAEGYRLGDTVTQTDSTIKIAGPKDVIDQIQSAGVVVDVTGATETLDVHQGFVYYDADGKPVEGTDVLEVTPESTEVTVTILKEKNVNLQMPILVGEDAVDTEFTLNTTVTMTDGTTNSFTNVILYEDGKVLLDGQEYAVDEDGRIHVELGQITVFGNTEYVTGGKLKELTLSGNTVAEDLELNGTDIDLLQDKVYSDVESVHISITKRDKEVLEIGGVRIEYPSHYKLSQTVLPVKVKGFPEDLENVSPGNIVAYLEAEVKESGRYPISVTINGHTGVTVVGEYEVYVTVARPTVDEGEGQDGPEFLT